MLDNMLEGFLAEHSDLAPTAQRRAQAANYTPGENILGDSSASTTQTIPAAPTTSLSTPSLQSLLDQLEENNYLVAVMRSLEVVSFPSRDTAH